MKRNCLTMMLVLLYTTSYALPIGNPAEASMYTNGICSGGQNCYEPCYDSCWTLCNMFSVRFGYYGDFVYNRNLQVKDGTQTLSHIKDTELYTNAGMVVLNLRNWLDLYATLGTTQMRIFTEGRALGNTFNPPDSTMILLNFDTTFSWSVGGRVVAWSCRCFDLGFEGQYLSCKSHFDNITRYATGNVRYFNAHNQANWHEMQIGATASYTYKTGCPGVAFIPYMGLKVATGTLDFPGMSGRSFSFDNQIYQFRNLITSKVVGYSVGMTAMVAEAAGITVEGRFADEKAVSVNGQLRF